MYLRCTILVITFLVSGCTRSIIDIESLRHSKPGKPIVVTDKMNRKHYGGFKSITNDSLICTTFGMEIDSIKAIEKPGIGTSGYVIIGSFVFLATSATLLSVLLPDFGCTMFCSESPEVPLASEGDKTMESVPCSEVF
jgi:hypothetical protein